MQSDKDMLLIEEHLKDLRREADKDRLARLARAGARPSILSRSLAWLGQQLVHWGCRLEARYKTMESARDEAGNELASSTIQQRTY